MNKEKNAQFNILIVEDEAIIAMDIESRLMMLGYKVAGSANSGERALALVEKSRPDLVLMDINIHGSDDGTIVAKKIWEQFRVPAVFLTAYSDDSTIARAVKSNPYGYLTKPLVDGELRAAIEVALYKHKTEKQLEEYRKALEQKVAELEAALEQVKELSALLPICAWCKNIRNEDGYWEEVSSYISKHTHTMFTHSICESCQKKIEKEGNPNA